MSQVRLAPWSPTDLPLLRLLNAPEMTAHLGGPETETKLLERQERYVAGGRAGSGGMFTVVLLPDEAARAAASAIGSGSRTGETVYERDGQSCRSVRAGASRPRRHAGGHRTSQRPNGVIAIVHAYPSVDNPASNAICRRVGFELLGEQDFEYPPGHPMRCNDWRFDLAPM